MTAGVQKIFHSDPRIGFLAQANVLREKMPALEQAVSAAKAIGDVKAIEAAEKARQTNRVLHFNNLLDAGVAAAFLVLVSSIVMLSLREWILLLARRKLAVLRESEPVWLPDYGIAEAKPLHVMGLVALAFALAKELSGEAQIERTQQAANLCECAHPQVGCNEDRKREQVQQLYLEVTEQRFNGVRRCC
jgi:hypothetical protein